MNKIAFTRFLGNLGILSVVLAITAAMLFGVQRVSWGLALFGLAMGPLFALTIFVMGWRFPKDMRIAMDEQSTHSETRSYILAYFACLIGFLIMLALCLFDMLDPVLAFYLMGLPIVTSPAYMVWAYLAGRAG